MTKSKLSRRIFSLMMALIMLITGIIWSSAEDEVSELKNQISQYEERIEAAQEHINSLRGDISKVQEYIEELDAQVARYQSQIDAYQAQIDEYEGQIAGYNEENAKLQDQIDDLNIKISGYNEEIDELNLKVDEKYDELKELIRTNFMTGETSALEVLLCSDDFSDYLTRVQFVSSLADYEQGLVDEINADIEEINKTIEIIAQERANIVKLQDQIDAQIAQIAALEADVEADQAKVQANQDTIQQMVDENSNYLEGLNDESAEYQAMIRQYENTIAEFDAEIESIIRAQASSGSGTLANSSGLIVPLQYSGVYVSSGFYRNSDGSYHGALDLCVSGGTYGLNISAAESGTVVTASYHWSYGNYMVVDHGNGLSTLYAHCSALAVSAGQSVSKGQTIGYVGSTGNSSGPHLHFEVRVNGSRVNPTGYISV